MENKLRKIIVADNADVGVGFFHEFCQADDNGNVNPFAIVESIDGQVYLVRPESVRFMVEDFGDQDRVQIIAKIMTARAKYLNDNSSYADDVRSLADELEQLLHHMGAPKIQDNRAMLLVRQVRIFLNSEKQDSDIYNLRLTIRVYEGEFE